MTDQKSRVIALMQAFGRSQISVQVSAQPLAAEGASGWAET
jgi:hypothetical protein